MIGLSSIEFLALRAALRTEGFGKVFQAEDAVAAAAILASELVHLVFTPAAGPGFTLGDVFNLLRGRGPNRQAPVVLVGIEVSQPEIVSSVKAGAVGVLTLPARKEPMRELLAKLFASAAEHPAASGATARSPSTPRGRRRNGVQR